jgi:hypothetical protein
MADNNQKASDEMPVSSALLASANWWFDFSWYGLLISGAIAALAAFGTVGFLFIQFWSSGVKERQLDWRTSVVELKSKQATADIDTAKTELARANEGIALANARAAEADEKAEGERLARVKIEEKLAPRSFASEQSTLLIARLIVHSGRSADILMAGETPEISGITGILTGILKSAGWKTDAWIWSGVGAFSGIQIALAPNASPEDVAAHRALIDALMEVGLLTAPLPWPIEWGKFPGMINGPPWAAENAAPIRIVIGTKP